MKHIISILLICCCICWNLVAQEVGTWKSYMAYYETTDVAEGNNMVFAVANGSLYSYGKEDNSLKFYSNSDGLSDSNIGKIGYNPTTHTLLIVYAGSNSDGNIDLLSEKGIYNLPYLKNSTNIQNKTINHIYFHNEYAYLSANFGIIVVNMSKQEIADTYRFNDEIVYATCIKGNEIYAVTDKGIRKASLNNNLLDNQNWSSYPLHATDFSDKDIRDIAVFNNTLCFYVKNKGIYYQNNGTITSLIKDSYTKSMTLQNGKLIALTANVAHIWTSLTDYNHLDLKKIGIQNAYHITNLKGNNYWIAAYTNGLVGIQVKGSNSAEVTVANLIQPDETPKRNLNYFMTMANNRLYVVGGGRWVNRFNTVGTLMVYADRKWFNFDESKVSAKDYTCVAVDPLDPTHYFVSTYGEGLLEFKDDQFVQKYTYENSTLQTAVSSDPKHYIRIGGIAFDKQGNLWVNNSSVSKSIHVLKADGTWKSMPHGDVISHIELLDKILVTSWGDKWINIPYKQPGIIVFNEKDVDNDEDDLYRYHTGFYNTNGTIINVSNYYCTAEDKNGNVWIGTDRGPIICSASSARKAAESDSYVYCTQIVRYEDDEHTIPSGYFLDGERVNAIAVDGGNRKWIGTESSGVFLVNADGSETIENFTIDNSPLLSNKVNSIVVDNVTGEVFIGTDKGLISYMGDATQGEESYSNVYAYPNPVRPEYADRVTITGLMSDSNVKITDLSGNLIYQAQSLGGQLTWNCRNTGGSRVATGIYLVLAATPEGKESVVTKIMIIK